MQVPLTAALLVVALCGGGMLSAADPPTIGPPGGTFQGPVMVTVTPQAGKGTLRVTIDGSEPAAEPYALDGSRPMTQSYAIRGPFRLSASAVVKARVFRDDGAPAGPIAEAEFVIQPRLTPGVPFYPVAWTADVETWWSQHPMNPGSPRPFAGPVVSPLPQINVADVRDRHPESDTAGIEEALNMLPAEGGTLWFPKDRGPYIVTKADSALRLPSGYMWGGAIKIRNRSNIHFVSDGAAIRCEHTIFGIAGGELDGNGQIEHPATNYYFRNLVFDGAGKAGEKMLFPQEGNFFHFLNTCDVLFDDCVFRNARNPGFGHGGLISLAFKSDNIWCRRCRFDSGLWGVYWDGVHGGGLVECTFGNGLTGGGFLLFTNDDLSPFDFRLRSAQYVVAAGCTFGEKDTPRKHPACAFVMAGENCLFADNTVNSAYRLAVYSNGKLCPSFRPYRYHYTGNRIVGNRLHGVDTLLEVRNLEQEKTHNYEIGDFIVEGNVATDLDKVLVLGHVEGVPRIHDVIVRDNELSGRLLPQIVVLPDGVTNIRIVSNVLSGAPRQPVVDMTGTALESDQIVVENNRVTSSR